MGIDVMLASFAEDHALTHHGLHVFGGFAEGVDVRFLEACAAHPHELALLVKAFGLTKTLDR